MARHLDVLALENRRGDARVAISELEARGHRVQRCHEDGEAPFPCRGVVDPNDCPLEGPIDVALVVRHHIRPHPSDDESGVACAIRAGVPVVEQGSSILDPFDAWITARVDDLSVADTCEQAVTLFHEPLIADIRRRCTPLLDAAGIDPSKVACAIELDWPQLRVRIALPAPVSSGMRDSMAVRALDAVRAGRRSYEKVNVQVREVEPDDAPDMRSC